MEKAEGLNLMGSCWICGADADYAEHMVKASDFRAVLPGITQGSPAFRHSRLKTNEPIKGAKAGILKFKPSLCSYCNNTRTQPHDKAWEALSHGLRNAKPPLRRGSRLPLKMTFPERVRASMLFVHLYFTKLLGCYAVEYGVPLPINEFADYILAGKAHPNLRLVFIHIADGSSKYLIQVGHIDAVNIGGRSVSAVWFYIVGRIGVAISYSEPAHAHMRLTTNLGWHPDDISPSIMLK